MIKRNISKTILLTTLLFYTSFFFGDTKKQINLNIDIELQKKINIFLKAPIEDLTLLSGRFTKNELNHILSTYKKSRNLQEQRILRLIEELATRKSEKITQKKFIFLFMAMISLILLFTLFSFLTYKKQRKIELQLKPRK